MRTGLGVTLQQRFVGIARVAHDPRRAASEHGEVGQLAAHDAAGAHESSAAEARAGFDHDLRADETVGADKTAPATQPGRSPGQATYGGRSAAARGADCA